MIRLFTARRVAGVTKVLEHSHALMNSHFTTGVISYRQNLSNSVRHSNEDKKKQKIPQQTGKNGKHILRRRVLPAVAIGGTAVVAAPVILCAVGFCKGGIAAGSVAAYLMSLYGGTVLAGSILAILQSAGAAGIGLVGNAGIFSIVSLTSARLMKMVSKIKQKIKR